MTNGRIRIGIGGWVYEPWRDNFYPAGLAKTKELAHASRHVTTIEINGTFYRMQSAATFARWASETPDDFVFALKASRYACNRKNLAEAGESIAMFVQGGITALGAKLGPILWQLAGTKKYNPDEIEGFLSALPKAQDGIALRHAIEPRHTSFQTPEFVAQARKYGVAVVLAISDDYPLIADQTGAFSYLRLQTTQAVLTTGYDEATLDLWKGRLDDLAAGKPAEGLPLIGEAAIVAPRDCFCYMIAGAKERNPAAAGALIARIGVR